MMWDVLGYYGLRLITYGGPLLIVYLLYKLWRDKHKVEEVTEEEHVVLSIMVPKNNEKTPLAAEQMFAALHGILRPHENSHTHVSFEIASQDKFTQFYIYAPTSLKDFIIGQVYAQYPTVEIKEVPDYTDVNIEGLAIAGTELKLTKEDVYPIKTFLSFEVDPLAGITSVLSKVEGEERVWVQILTMPVDDSWQDRGVKLVKMVREGGEIKLDIGKDIFKHFLGILGEIVRTLLTPPKKEEKKEKKKEDADKKKLPGPQETAMTGVETKVQKLGFATKIRILVIERDEFLAKAKLNAVVGVFKQFNTTNLNGFTMGNIATGKELLSVFQLRPYGNGGSVFNIEELASLYHFPHVSVETPSIVWAGSKKGEPPANLPTPTTVPSEELTAFAVTNFRHLLQQFGLKGRDRRLHTYIIGKTGTGKSNLQRTMIIDDIREGRGVAVVDPHGDLVKQILDFIPEERIQDVVYLNPADHEFPVGFNLLENVDPELKNIVASGLMSVFTKLWEGVWSARMEYILRNCIMALLEYPNATFLGIMRLLVDKRYRTRVLEHVTDPVIRDFFLNEYEKYDPKFRTEAIAPIQNKVGQFLSSTIIRNIVGQQKSTIDMKQIMDTGKILLIDLAIGKVGEDNSALLGSMLITKIQLSAMERVDTPEEERRDFYLYVDEFQNFATESFAVILSEARKYHLNLILANQYIAQMPEVVSDAIFGNVGTMITFRVGATDAEKLVKEFEPVFDANDMVNLPNYQIYIKMAIDGVTCPAFSATTLPPITEVSGNKEMVIEFSRGQYGRPRTEVEAEIASYANDEEPAEGKLAEKTEKAPKVPLQIGRSIYKEISAKGAIKWYFYDREEGEEDKMEEGEEAVSAGAMAGKEDMIDKRETEDPEPPGAESNNSPTEPLILAHEAHRVVQQGQPQPKGHNNKNSREEQPEPGSGPESAPAAVNELQPLKDGELIDIGR